MSFSISEAVEQLHSHEYLLGTHFYVVLNVWSYVLIKLQLSIYIWILMLLYFS